MIRLNPTHAFQDRIHANPHYIPPITSSSTIYNPSSLLTRPQQSFYTLQPNHHQLSIQQSTDILQPTHLQLSVFQQPDIQQSDEQPDVQQPADLLQSTTYSKFSNWHRQLWFASRTD
jgi:hypothetical protein